MVFAKISKQLSAIEVEKEGWTKQKVTICNDTTAEVASKQIVMARLKWSRIFKHCRTIID